MAGATRGRTAFSTARPGTLRGRSRRSLQISHCLHALYRGCDVQKCAWHENKLTDSCAEARANSAKSIPDLSQNGHGQVRRETQSHPTDTQHHVGEVVRRVILSSLIVTSCEATKVQPNEKRRDVQQHQLCLTSTRVWPT